MKLLKRINLILLVLFVGISILLGCSGKNKVPEGFNKELWNDSVQVSEILYKEYKNKLVLNKEEKQVIKDYEDKYSKNFTLSEGEETVVHLLTGAALPFEIEMYVLYSKEGNKNQTDKYNDNIQKGFKILNDIIK